MHKRKTSTLGASITQAYKAPRTTTVIVKKAKPKFRYSMLYRNMTRKIYEFTDKAELLINLNSGNGAGGGVGASFSGAGSTGLNGAGGVAANGFAIWFSLQEYGFVNSSGTTNGQFLNYSEYSSLFDAYRIDEVVIDMMFTQNSSAMVTTGLGLPAATMPVVYLATDYDDSSPPATNILFQYSSCKNLQFGNSSGDGNGHQYYKLTPAVLITTGTAGGSALSTIKKHQWLDTDQPTVQQYGIKGWYDNPLQTGAAAAIHQGYITCVFKIKFCCKMTK